MNTVAPTLTSLIYLLNGVFEIQTALWYFMPNGYSVCESVQLQGESQPSDLFSSTSMLAHNPVGHWQGVRTKEHCLGFQLNPINPSSNFCEFI